MASDSGERSRGGQVQRVVEQVRGLVVDGRLRPGAQLSEERLCHELGVSRHTLREAFRLLSHEGLLEQRFHRGTFVRLLGPEDLIDLYRVRLFIEPQVVHSLNDHDRFRLGPLGGAVEAGESAEGAGDWDAVITANTHFHQSLVALARSARLSRMATQVLTEMRLVFALVEDPQPLYVPFIAENRRVYESLLAGEFADSAELVEDYLHRSRSQLQAALGWS